MVRINLIKPYNLTDQHLNAEYVEIKILLRFMLKYPNGEIPNNYTLNKGHMSFFRDKGLFILKRFLSIIDEMINRGVKLNYNNIIEVLSLISNLNDNQLKDFKPTYRDVKINLDRINDRIKKPIKLKYYTYYKKPVLV